MTGQPSYYIPHGGGPCFFMDDPHQLWGGMEAFLRGLPDLLPRQPSAILLVSAHWETKGFSFTGAQNPQLIYDYYGFPAHTYQIEYNAPGSPELADRACALMQAAGLMAQVDPVRGLDHGAFIPLKVAFPKADIPVVEMSLDHSLDPALHLRAGEALQALRDENVLIVGSGMSFHNMSAYGNPRYGEPSRAFDAWLAAAMALTGQDRAKCLAGWVDAPAGRLSHPREEHLLPAMVAAGASDAPGQHIYTQMVMATAISAFSFA
jgi:aromatic ring-opening dioxygenase catalytic subunit (LigB family)